MIFDEITNHLREYDCHPISNASDGAETERKMQRRITTSNPTVTHRIAASNPLAMFDIVTTLLNGRPHIAVQDSKHGGKTVRNQLSSGARVVTIGVQLLGYFQLHLAVNTPDCPLMMRDVIAFDRQCDRAPARLLSPDFLVFLQAHFPDWVGLGVYLFVMGGLYEAWQNRSMSDSERARRVMRTRYFLVAWRANIEHHPHHSTSIHFISRESFDIFITLCDSMIALLRLHRDYYPNHPFYPWLHSTETNEHLHGVARMIKEDFTFVDLLHLLPKTAPLLLGSTGRLHNLKPNATASGYHHTWFSAEGANSESLKVRVTDADLDKHALAAYAEANDLLHVCGCFNPQTATFEPQTLPPAPANALHPDRDGQAIADTIVQPEEQDELIGEEVLDDVLRPSAILRIAQELEEIGNLDGNKLLSSGDIDRITQLSYAHIGDTLDKGNMM